MGIARLLRVSPKFGSGELPGHEISPSRSQLWHSRCMTQQNKRCTVILFYFFKSRTRRVGGSSCLGKHRVLRWVPACWNRGALVMVSVPLRNSSPLRPACWSVRVTVWAATGARCGVSFLINTALGGKRPRFPSALWGPDSRVEETVRPGPEAVTLGRAG